jgi:hypothetical protein
MKITITNNNQIGKVTFGKVTRVGDLYANDILDLINTVVYRSGSTMTGNLNVAATIITQNVIPSVNNTFNLGSPTYRYKDAYFGGNTVYIGGSILSAQANSLVTNTFIATTSFVSGGLNVLDQANAAYAEANSKLGIGGGTITGSLIVTGNLEVLGNTTSLNVETLSLEDNEIILNSNVTGAPLLDSFITINRGSSTNAVLKWDESTNQWKWSDGNGVYYALDSSLGAYAQANGAYAQANGAYAQANGAYSQANGAFAQANGAYAQANGAYAQANGAYAQANAASDNANTRVLKAGDTMTGQLNISSGGLIVTGNIVTTGASGDITGVNTIYAGTFSTTAGLNVTAQAANAYEQANNARTTANGAYLQANGAYAQANGAYAQANGAYAQANGAYSQANGAYAQANGVYAHANGIYDVANAAYAQANADYQPAVTRFDVTSSGTSAYRFDQYGSIVDDPTLYVRAGETLAFNLNVVGHPFMIRQSNGGANYNTGLTHVETTGVISTGASAQGKTTGVLYWKVPFELQGNTYVYQCQVHSAMVGNIVIEPPSTIIYAQANTALDAANGAYSQANAGYATANAAYATANTKLNSSGGTITGPISGLGNSKLDLTTFGANSVYLTTTNDDSTALFMGAVSAELYANTNVQIRANTGGASQNWTFGADGTLTFPDTTVQTTAFTTELTNAISNTVSTVSTIANAAYAQANTARSTANDSYVQANTARNQANTARDTGNNAYAQANTVLDTANGAYAQANGAYAQANGAYAQANLAFGQANGAYAHANIVYAQANAAFNQANTGNDSANAAYAQANTARDTGNSAYGQANTARTTANAAYAQANTALDTANGAYAQANTARDTANAAYGQANSAFNQANAAYDKANTALNTANGAYAQANGAYAHANIVYAQANDAYGTANTKLSTSGGSISGDLTISGNLVVQGNATTINVSSLSVNDSIILLSANSSGDAEDIGFVGHITRDAVTTHVGFFRKATENQFYVFDNYETEPTNNVIDIANNNFRIGNVRLGILNANSVLLLGNSVATQANLTLAYNQANTANNTANGAYSQANGAYAHANIVYAQANAAYDNANTRVLKSGDTMTGNLNVSAFIITNNVQPNLNVTYDLGSPTKRYKNLYLSNNALHLGDAVITSNGSTLIVSGVEIDGSGNLIAAFDSYDQANTARDTANAAYNQANGAFNQANGAYAHANIVYAQANAAYDQANTARGTANDAYAQANTARDTANGAYNQANTARTTANDSYNQANTARNTANDAYGQANTARTTANDSYAQANTARNTANDSYAQANTARNTANDSYAQANTARTTANDAYNTANTANATANLAYAQANSNYQPAVTRLNVTNSGFSAYLLDQYPGNNPTVYVRGGETLAFNLNVSGHPFMIRQSSGGANYNTGLTHVSSTGVVSTDGSAQGQVSGTLYWKVPYNIVGNTYVYQCSIHGSMVGNIVIEPSVIVAYAQANAAFDTANGAYAHANIVYAQANAAYNDANGAYAQANGAYLQANGAYAQANGAYAQANGAYAQANIVYAQANTAYEKANAPITVKEIYAGNSTVVNTYTNINTIQFDSDSGMAVVNAASNTVTIQLNSTFKNWNVDGNAGLVAVGLDTVNFIAGSGISIAANNNASPKSITFTSTGGGGGAANVIVKDEGTTLTSAVTSIDFTGGGVTATASGSNVTISVPVGLSNTIIKTTSYTSVNAAANLTYALPTTPSEPWYIFVIKNGIVLTPNTDYSVSGNTLTVIESGAANDSIEVRYFDQLNLQEYPNTRIEVNSNTVASQTNTFYVTSNVAAISRLSISKNGLMLTPNLHFTVTGNTVTLNTAAEINDVLTFTHIRDLGPLEGSGLTEYNYNTSTSSVETVDSWSKNTYRSGKYQVQVESGTGYYATEIMIIHDDSTTNLIQYGTSSFGSNVGVFSSDISGSNVRLLFTATDATSFVTYNRVLLTKRSSESLPTDLMTGSDAYDLMLTLPFNPTDLN